MTVAFDNSTHVKVHQRRQKAAINDLLTCQTCYGKGTVATREICEDCHGTGTMPFPAVEDPERKESCRYDLLKFCENYKPRVFYAAWSENHYIVADRIQSAVLKSGRFALAMPRGSGKTSMCEAAAEWATSYGHCSFVVIIGATQRKAEERIASIKTDLRSNPEFLADFPEVAYAFWHVDGGWRKFESQTLDGVKTGVIWQKDKIVLPRIEANDEKGITGHPGAVIYASGLTGSELRGLTHKLEGGEVIRPDFAIPDDPQTRESAKSFEQSKFRSDILAGDVSYMAGPQKRISMVVPCTVIYQNDMADQLLNHEKHPEYRGVRTKMLLNFPKNMKLWAKYNEILKDSLLNDGDMAPATEFYRSNQAEMDEGAVVTWPERFAEDELSGIQHAMNRFYDNESAFYSECQNEPIEDQMDDDMACTPAEVVRKTLPYPRMTVMTDTAAITGFIDIQKTCLVYGIVGWKQQFDGLVVNYDIFPHQKRRTFTKYDIRESFDTEFPGFDHQIQVRMALEVLTNLICTTDFPVDSGGTAKVDRLLIDANWLTSTVYQFCRESPFQGIVQPCHGRYVGASNQPWAEWARKSGEKVGQHWRDRRSKDWNLRYVIFDSNWWKSFVHQRMKVQVGGIGLFGKTANAVNISNADQYHSEFAHQFCAEFPIKTEFKGRVVYEWKMKSGHEHNEGLDIITGAAVAASMEGIAMEKLAGPTKKRAPALTLEEMQRAAQGQNPI